MIFKLSHWQGIKNGDITLAFRKWKKPGARPGSRVRSEMGVIEITEVTPISEKDISTRDAKAAGFESVDELLKILRGVEEGRVYKINLRFHSEDPRIALRSQASLNEIEFETLRKKLDRLDKAGRDGKWTMEVLKAIGDNPELRAADLAKKLKKDKDMLKIDIRKLKNLGLTISHEVGYTISPLGEFVLRRLGRG